MEDNFVLLAGLSPEAREAIIKAKAATEKYVLANGKPFHRCRPLIIGCRPPRNP